MPPPHPTSITLRPSSGLAEYGSLLEVLTLEKKIEQMWIP
jgi:hypothetical protein